MKFQTTLLASLCIAVSLFAAAQDPKAPEHGVRPDTFIIRHATIVDGTGAPAEGNMTIVFEDNVITHVYPESAVSRPGFVAPKLTSETREIDATGKYVLPGFINMHAHIHGPWGVGEVPTEYLYKLWLAAGITTVRDVGSVAPMMLSDKKKSAAGEIAAPRIYAYLWYPKGMIGASLTDVESVSEPALRKEVVRLKETGADGLKLRGFDSEITEIVADEAKKQGLPIANHLGLKDVDAADAARYGIRTLEHFYGVADAAIDGVQEFPADFDHNNELLRFRYAGRLWREADPDALLDVLKTMVENDMAWVPTFAIYEASRDLQRAITQPAFRDYLHPALEKFFAPNPENHGSYFFGWTNTDEVYWKENYKIWMKAVRNFADMGGTVATGEDAGFIYQLFGFCYLRELQLHEEAGFHPLEVIKHATSNSAKALGEQDRLGKIRPGHLADLVIVNGNPLENLAVLMPRGLNDALDQQNNGVGGIEWTIKDGIPYHAPSLLKDVQEIVDEARNK